MSVMSLRVCCFATCSLAIFLGSAMMLSLSIGLADAAPGGFDLSTSTTAVGVSHVAEKAGNGVRPVICPRCGEPELSDGECSNCGLSLKDRHLPLPPAASTRGRIRPNMRAFTRTQRGINQSMRDITNSTRDMRRDISRIRDLRRRF
jgi:hypothetical protein